MASFAIRVELRGDPIWDKYQTLHALMKELGFSQRISGVDGNGKSANFDLPHAVYYGDSADPCILVRDRVLRAVKTRVQESVIVFVVEVQNWALAS